MKKARPPSTKLATIIPGPKLTSGGFGGTWLDILWDTSSRMGDLESWLRRPLANSGRPCPYLSVVCRLIWMLPYGNGNGVAPTYGPAGSSVSPLVQLRVELPRAMSLKTHPESLLGGWDDQRCGPSTPPECHHYWTSNR